MEDDEAAGRKSNTRAPSTQGIAQEDLSGEDSDEWKPEDHPQPSDDDEDAMEVETLDKEEQEEKVEGGGRWVHKLTGDSLGGPEGYLEFTVIG